ncbi:LysR substrate-binding domain-containing protein [Nocardia sp. NPDC004654]|uniref:LysR substrate-binding domain-containing protein n=1 Tax=Nocardia sp. NPDC004654 TaxID=3154776 RepID=UPI00339E5030
MTLPPGTPDLDVLDLLVSVAELGSLGAAARRHGISQPAASMRISALERRLHLRLLDRGPTGSALTDAGRAVVDHARPVLESARSFGTAVAALRADNVPRLRIAASKTIADHRIPQWLQVLRGAHPEVAVALEVANSSQVLELVRREAADLGFVEGPHPPADLGSRVLGTDELVVVVSPAHPWARRRGGVSPRELAATPLLWREPGSGTRDAVREVLAGFGEPARPAAELGSAATIIAAARTAVAPAVVSRLIAAPELERGTLVEVSLTESTALTRRFRVVWRPRFPLSGPARLLAEIAERTESDG